MTVLSVRQAMNAMGTGATGNLSVMRDVLGFWQGRAPTDPSTNTPVVVSLGQAFTGLSGRHINVNIIKVGFDVLSSGALTTEEAAVDYGIHRTRQVYAGIGLGVGRVGYYWITAAASNGRDDLGSDSESDTLSDEWSVPNDGLDVFCVRSITYDNVLGVSPRPGDCSKGGKSDGMIGGETGRGDPDGWSRTLAHEMGHYLDLPHNHGDTCPTATTARENLMAQTRCCVTTRSSVLLTSSQGSTMRGRCQVRAGS